MYLICSKHHIGANICRSYESTFVTYRISIFRGQGNQQIEYFGHAMNNTHQV